MPVALSVVGGKFCSLSSSSSWERLRVGAGAGALDFLEAALLLGLAVARWEDSSAARRASRSAFLRAASAFLSASAALKKERRGC